MWVLCARGHNALLAPVGGGGVCRLLARGGGGGGGVLSACGPGGGGGDCCRLLVDAIINYLSSILAPPQPCARGHMSPPSLRHWVLGTRSVVLASMTHLCINWHISYCTLVASDYYHQVPMPFSSLPHECVYILCPP